MPGCECADLRMVSTAGTNADNVPYLHAQCFVREGSTSQAKLVSQRFLQASREVFRCWGARQGNRLRLALTTPTQGIHVFHLGH
jgi:hypothetical protein